MKRSTGIFIFVILIITKCKEHTFTSAHSLSPNRELSREEIRDAILALVNIFRDNSDKLERHEARERQLGDQLKNSFTLVEKNQKIEEKNLATILDRLFQINTRLETIENIVLKTEVKTNGSSEEQMNEFQKYFEEKLKSLEEIAEKFEANFQNVKTDTNSKLDSILSNIKQTNTTVLNLQQIFLENLPFIKNSKTETKLEDIYLEMTIHYEKLNEVLKLQQIIIENLNFGLKIEDFNNSINVLLNRLCESEKESELKSENEIAKLKAVIETSNEILQQEQKNLLSAILNCNTTNNGLNKNVEKNYEQIFTEIKNLSKIEQVLIQTADSVLDTRRRVEYGTHHILLEVEHLIKLSAQDTNDTINKRFDMISDEIVYSQDGALRNLSVKIETEISQVWRQIGIMYQTLTNSADALNKLQLQTEIYVNGSLITMDNMEGTVGQITGKMGMVDDNLNYLLGRLSLVTQEFNQIKLGLGEALDNIRSSFHTVQDKVKNVGPGPNPIEEEVTGFDTLLQENEHSTI